MNSAIIGDSPIMLILANYLKSKENITIYSDKIKLEVPGHTPISKILI